MIDKTMNKILTPITDKNGKKTSVWRNTGGTTDERSQALSAPSTASSTISSIVPETITVTDSQNNAVTLRTDEWTIEAERVFTQGQCAAFAYNLRKDWYPEATIKSATSMNGKVLIHVWLEDEGMVVDGEGEYYIDESEYIEQLQEAWGTPDIVEHTPESLRSWIESQNADNKQGWDAAGFIVQAWVNQLGSD